MESRGDRHLIVTRFAVPRPQAATAALHCDPEWLRERLRLFQRYYVPSVSRTGVTAILLCSTEAADLVASDLAIHPWVRIEVQDEWHGGWTAPSDCTITRLDSDDALHHGWFDAVDRAPDEAKICITRDFLRWDTTKRRLHRYHRTEPSPLAAFRAGVNPYSIDHKRLDSLPGVHCIPGSYLLQIVHQYNVKNRPPKAWRIDRRESLRCLDAFGIPREDARRNRRSSRQVPSGRR